MHPRSQDQSMCPVFDDAGYIREPYNADNRRPVAKPGRHRTFWEDFCDAFLHCRQYALGVLSPRDDDETLVESKRNSKVHKDKSVESSTQDLIGSFAHALPQLL